MVEKILGIREVSEMCGNLSWRVICQAFASGELPGKNFGGRRGWATTRTAVFDWIESGNAPAEEEES